MSEPRGPGYPRRPITVEEARQAAATVKAQRQEAMQPQPHPFETAPPRVVITDESDKGPDEAKKPTSWVPDQKVSYGGIGGAITVLLISILKSYGVEIDLIDAGAIATLVTMLVQYLLPVQNRNGS